MFQQLWWGKRLVLTKLALVTTLLLGLGVLVSSYVVAVRADTPKQQSPIDFLEDKDFLVDYDWLHTQKDVGTLRITVRNNLPYLEQTITVQLAGMLPMTGTASSELSKLISPVISGQVKVPGGQTGDVALTFKTAGNRPAAGKYEGSLVATGSAGGIARRKFILQVAGPTPTPAPPQSGTPPPPTTVPAIVRPDVMDSVPLSGTRYVPSFLSPLDPTLFYWSLGILALFGIVVLLLLPDTWTGKLVRMIGIIDILLALLVASLFVQGCDKLTRINPVSFSDADSKAPIIGGVSSPDGSLGSLVLTNGQLTAQNIHRAGKYTGQIDTMPTVDTKGNVKVALNVADIWPLALLTVALGAFLGYWIVDYFQRRRAKELYALGAQEIVAEAQETDRKFSKTHKGCKVENSAFYEHAVAWKARIEKLFQNKLLTASDASTNAKASLEQLVKYFQTFKMVRLELCELEHQRNAAWEQVRQPNLIPTSISVFKAADELLNEPLVPSGETDAEGTELSARLQKIRQVADRLWRLSEMDSDVVDLLREADNIETDDKEELQRQKDALKRIRDVILRADSVQGIREQDAAVRVVRDKLDELRTKKPQPIAQGTKARGLEDAEVMEVLRREVKNAVSDILMKGNFPKDNKLVVDAEPPTKDERAALRQGQRVFSLTDTQMTILTGLLAVLSGFASLYLVNPGWGAPADYLNAFLWGSVASQGLKLLSNVISRLGLQV